MERKLEKKRNRMPLNPKSKVLLVEDDAAMQAVLRTLLEIEGFEVVIAPNLYSLPALSAFIIDGNPDVMLLDYHIREISGLDLLRSLRAGGHIKNTRVVMTSGEAVQERCIDAGADSFLLKPFMPDELIKQLRGEQAP
jgi:DNA-binding response OmpR family regulator